MSDDWSWCWILHKQMSSLVISSCCKNLLYFFTLKACGHFVSFLVKKNVSIINYNNGFYPFSWRSLPLSLRSILLFLALVVEETRHAVISLAESTLVLPTLRLKPSLYCLTRLKSQPQPNCNAIITSYTIITKQTNKYVSTSSSAMAERLRNACFIVD